MATYPWPTPPKRKGKHLKPVAFRMSEPFLGALKELAEQENVAQATILMELSLRANRPAVRARRKLRQLVDRHTTPTSSETTTPTSAPTGAE